MSLYEQWVFARDMLNLSICYERWKGFWQYVGIGLMFAVYYMTLMCGEGHYWVLEKAKMWGCGNKFMECRGWD
jgi:hypothetical protein